MAHALRPIVHMVLHLVVPGLAARLFYRENWLRAWMIMTATMLIDLDHLLATPVYDPNRCGIGVHPLHSVAAIGGYALMTLFPKWRLVGIGLLIHMGLDLSDCLWMAAAVPG